MEDWMKNLLFVIKEKPFILNMSVLADSYFSVNYFGWWGYIFAGIPQQQPLTFQSYTHWNTNKVQPEFCF